MLIFKPYDPKQSNVHHADENLTDLSGFRTIPERIVIESCVHGIFMRHRQLKRHQREAGGILLGSRWPDSLWVEQISEPCHRDKSGRTFFERNAEKAQDLINKAWQNSQGTFVYLGEWHTHPEPIPNPSTTDCAMIHQMFANSTPRYGSLIMLIVGTDGFWVGCQSEDGLFTFKLQEDED